MTQNRSSGFSGARMDNPHVEQFIVTHELRGKGEYPDPYRRILTVWTLDGQKVAEETDPQDAVDRQKLLDEIKTLQNHLLAEFDKQKEAS